MRADGIEESIMPKKDTAAAVVAMLSTAGAQTRRVPEPAEAPAPISVAPVPPAAPSVTVTEPAPATVSTLPPPVAPARRRLLRRRGRYGCNRRPRSDCATRGWKPSGTMSC